MLPFLLTLLVARNSHFVKDEILLDLDYSDFDTKVDCIKGKLTAKIRNAKADRCTKLLGVIHTDICGSFTPPTMGDHKYFITFIDDYSRYGFVELIREKSDSLEAFKLSKLKLSSNKGRRSKWFILTGGEYYGRYDEKGRNLEPFEKYL